MSREISRRTSKPPEMKGKVSRPDVVGRRGLDPRIVEDRVDPAFELEREQREREARDQDRYLRTLSATEGKSKGGK